MDVIGLLVCWMNLLCFGSTRWVALRLIVWWFGLLFDFVVIVVALWLDLFVVSLGYSVDFGFCFWGYGVVIVV